MELLSIFGGIALVLIIGYIVSVMGRALMNLARNLLILILASAFPAPSAIHNHRLTSGPDSTSPGSLCASFRLSFASTVNCVKV